MWQLVSASPHKWEQDQVFDNCVQIVRRKRLLEYDIVMYSLYELQHVVYVHEAAFI